MLEGNTVAGHRRRQGRQLFIFSKITDGKALIQLPRGSGAAGHQQRRFILWMVLPFINGWSQLNELADFVRAALFDGRKIFEINGLGGDAFGFFGG